MKFFAIFLIGLFAVSQADLQKDFDDLKKLIPKEDVQKLVGKHSFLDNEFIQFRKFLRTPEFSKVWDTLIANEKVKNVIEFAKESGADVVKGINEIAKILNLKSYPQLTENHIEPRTVKSFMNSFVQTLSKSDIPEAMKQKVQNSAEFKKFVNTFTSEEMVKLLKEMTADETVKTQLQILEKHGLRYKDVLNAAAEVLNWAF